MGCVGINDYIKFISKIYTAILKLSKDRLFARIGENQLIILNTKGRKMGKLRIIPLGFMMHNRNYLIVGSNNGDDHHPDWYYNLKSDPNVSVELKCKQMRVTARLEKEYDEYWRIITEKLEIYNEYLSRN